MKKRLVHTKEVVTDIEFTIYRGDRFPRPPMLHNRRLIVDEWACYFEREMSAAMMYGFTGFAP